jgi:hypothetical protein
MSVTSHQITVADLKFNDSRFLGSRTSPKEKHKDAQLSTRGESNHDEDETSDNFNSVLRQQTDFLTASVTDKIPNGKEKPGHGSQEDSSSLNGSDPESSPESPGTMLKKLVKTGIFDGMGILNLTSDKTMESNLVQDGEDGILQKAQLVKGPGLNEEGSMADPGKETLLSTTQSPSNIAKFYQKRYGRHRNRLVDTLCLERQNDKFLVYTHNTTQVCSSDLANPASMRDGHEPSVNQNLSPDLKSAHNPAFNGRRQSVSRTSEGGHHYIQCVDEKDQRRPTLTSPDSDPADFGYLVHPQDVQNPEPRGMELPILGDWRRYDEIKSLQQPLADQHPVHLVPGHAEMPGPNPVLFPIPLQVCPIHDESNNTQAEQPRQNRGNETIQEFFERIEGEVSLN